MKRRAQPWLGTLVDIALADEADEIVLRNAFDRAFAEVALVHRLMSFHDCGSDVSLINRALPGEAVAVHGHTHKVLRIAEMVHSASEGVFDIGCAPRLVEHGHLPAGDTPAPEYVPGRPVIYLRDDGSVQKLADGWIDLGGIAKGYAVDLAIDAIRGLGIRSACVNAGGDLRVIGPAAIPVALRDPAAPTRVCAEISVREEALATSAAYFSGKERDGLWTSALFNGLNGMPVVSAASVSVRAPSCMLADALTKVVLATQDVEHPSLQAFGATALML